MDGFHLFRLMLLIERLERQQTLRLQIFMSEFDCYKERGYTAHFEALEVHLHDACYLLISKSN